MKKGLIWRVNKESLNRSTSKLTSGFTCNSDTFSTSFFIHKISSSFSSSLIYPGQGPEPILGKHWVKPTLRIRNHGLANHWHL